MLSGPGRLVTRRCAENRKVSGLITWSEAKVGVVELVAAVSVNPSSIWTLGHDDEARALTAGIVQAAEAPQERVAWRRKLWV